MARSRTDDLISTLRAQGVRKRVAKALSELEGGRKSAGGRAEKLARQAIKDLRQAASEIEKRLGGATPTSRARGAKKAAATRKRAASKRSAAAKRGAATRSRKSTSRKSTGRKTTSRKSTARRTARKS